MNWEGYITAGSRWQDIQRTAGVWGWDKAVFGISTQRGAPGIGDMARWSGDEVTSGIIAQAKGADPKGSGVKGVFFWTAEWSAPPATSPCSATVCADSQTRLGWVAGTNWSPLWCFEEIMSAALNGEPQPDVAQHCGGGHG